MRQFHWGSSTECSGRFEPDALSLLFTAREREKAVTTFVNWKIIENFAPNDELYQTLC